MQVDRRKFIASAAGAAAVAAMGHGDRAEALEHYMTDQLDRAVRLSAVAQSSVEPRVPRGTGNLFQPTTSGFEPMPANATLVDFFKRRFAPARSWPASTVPMYKAIALPLRMPSRVPERRRQYHGL